MTNGSERSVLSLLQPDLFSIQELSDMLKARCCHLKNLDSMTKENLVSLFRRVILPLPQRLYRANRRGKMLTARRVKSGLEGCSGGGEGGGGGGEAGGRLVNSQMNPRSSIESGNRLKPPPSSVSGKIRTSTTVQNSSSLDKIVINDRRKSNHQDNPKNQSSSPSKRSHQEMSSSDKSSENSGGKKQRVAIKWP